MLTWPHKSYTCGDDTFYPPFPVICVRDAEALLKAFRCLESRVGDAAAWEALCWGLWGVVASYLNLITGITVAPGGWMRLMPQSWPDAPNRLTCSHSRKTRLSTGEARGTNSLFVSVLDVCGVWSQLDVHLLQAVLVSLSVRFFSSLPSWAVCAEWEGDGGVEGCVCYCVIYLVKR